MDRRCEYVTWRKGNVDRRIGHRASSFAAATGLQRIKGDKANGEPTMGCIQVFSSSSICFTGVERRTPGTRDVIIRPRQIRHGPL